MSAQGAAPPTVVIQGLAGMPLFVVLLRYVRPLSDIDVHLPAHRAWLQSGYRDGWLLVSGPQRPRTGGVLLARARDAAEVWSLLDADPFRREGLADYQVIEFEASMYASGEALSGHRRDVRDTP